MVRKEKKRKENKTKTKQKNKNKKNIKKQICCAKELSGRKQKSEQLQDN